MTGDEIRAKNRETEIFPHHQKEAPLEWIQVATILVDATSHTGQNRTMRRSGAVNQQNRQGRTHEQYSGRNSIAETDQEKTQEGGETPESVGGRAYDAVDRKSPYILRTGKKPRQSHTYYLVTTPQQLDTKRTTRHTA